MNTETRTTVSGNGNFALQNGVLFRRVRELPEYIIPQVNDAIKGFMSDSHMAPGVDLAGFYEATLQGMANATYLSMGGCDMWIGTLEGQLVAFVMGSIVKEIDNKLTYWVSQAWVRRDQRRQQWVRDAWQKIRTRAKESFCSHMVVVSSRNDAAYCRWLGKGWHRYAGLLKEDFNGRSD